jgi:glycosyltransferase involved in cell wall biosynthesis
LGECDPFVRYTAKKATTCYVTTKQSADRVLAIGGANPEQYFESGFSQSDLYRLGMLDIRFDSPIRFMSVGRLLDWKGFQLGLRAFAEAAIPDAQYWIIGDGPVRESLERQVKKLGIQKSVKFWGLVERSKVLDLLMQCNALVHPSLHDSGGWVCLEAMAAGRPVICLDWGGPGFQVSAETGYKIVPDNPAQVVKEMASSMRDMFNNEQGVRAMSDAARARVKDQFAWVVKGNYFSNLYTRIAQTN